MNKDWNQMSDESDDSWFDDDEPPKTNSISKQEGENAQTQQQTSNNGPANQENKVETKSKQQSEKPKYLTDAEILAQLQEGKIEEKKTIKVVNCVTQQAQKILENVKNIRNKHEIRAGMYIVNFNSEEDLITFIKDKITNRWRFFLHPFIPKKPTENKERSYRSKNQNNQQTRGKKRYSQKNQQEKKYQEDKKYEKKEEELEKNERKKYLPKNEQIIKKFLSKENDIHIIDSTFEIQGLVNHIQINNFANKFRTIRIHAKFETFEKISDLCLRIYKKIKFGLEENPPLEVTETNKEVLFTLVQNTKDENTIKFYQRYHKTSSKEVKQSKSKKQYIKPKYDDEEVKKEERIQNARKLNSEIQKYFEDINKYNLSEIQKDFNEPEYLKNLSLHLAEIYKNWKSWKIQAEGDLIENALRFSHTIQNNLPLNCEIKLSIRNGQPMLILEFQFNEEKSKEREKEKRPKVDVSYVNSYLSA